MNIIITMAGAGSRFKKAGFLEPKYMLKAHKKSLLEWSLLSLSGFMESENNYFFIVRKEDNAVAFIQSVCSDLGLSNIQIIEIDYLTKGQAETAMLAVSYCNISDQLLVYNIDTYIEPYEMNLSQLKGDGFIPCFRGKGDHWSFVRLDLNGTVTEIKEKKRISDYCTVGAYYFKTCKLFKELYTELYCVNDYLEAGERYIAPMYDLLIKKGGRIYINDIPVSKVHVLGTPEELEIFQRLKID